jgi:hypothetical protein
MNPELQQRLENVPEDESRSRLEPYRELILRWRRQRRSFRKIRAILADECKLIVSQQAIQKFVKLRTRPRKPTDAEPLAAEMPAAVTQQQEFGQTAQTVRRNRPVTTGRESDSPSHKPSPTRTLFDTNIESRATVIRGKEEPIVVWKP